MDYRDDIKNRGFIALAVVFGAFLSVMDVSVVNVALPHMMGNFGQTLSAITWVATSYSIAEIIMVTMSGWLSAVMGRKTLYLSSFVLFTIGSILCGIAQNFPQMLLFRTLQGIGGGSLIPISQAILRETFPPKEQGMAMAFFGMGVVLAPAIGPVAGGWLTDHYGWPWIFYINIPFSIMGIAMVAAFVHDPPYLRRGVKSVDWLGIILLSAGLTLLQIILERGQEKGWFESRLILAGTIVTALIAAALIIWEWTNGEPIVNLRLLKNVPLALGSAIILLFGIALYGTTFVLPQFTQELLGYPAYQAGLVLLPRAIAIFLAMPLVGRLYNFLDVRVMMLIGVAISYVAYQRLAHLTLVVSMESLFFMLLLMGSGMPFMFITLSTASLSTIPRQDMTAAAGIYTLLQRIGGNLGYSLIATLVERRSQFHRMHLIEHVSLTSPGFLEFYRTLTPFSGSASAGLSTRALVMVNGLVNRQSLMLAYNDISWLLAMMFLCTIPLILFFPKVKAGAAGEAPVH